MNAHDAGKPASAAAQTRSTGVLYPRTDAVHRRHQRAVIVIVRAAGCAPALQQIPLQQVDRIDVGIAQADGLAQRRSPESSSSAPRSASTALRVRSNSARIAGRTCMQRPGQANSPRRCPDRIGQHHFHIVDQGLEEGPAGQHLGHLLQAPAADAVFQSGATPYHAVRLPRVCDQAKTGIAPQRADVTGPGTLGRPRLGAERSIRSIGVACRK